MPTIHIGTQQPLPELRSDLDEEISRLGDGGVFINIKERKLGKYNFLDFSLSEGVEKKEPEEKFLTIISLIVANLLLGRISKDFIYKITRIDHPYLTKEEAWSLCDQVISSLSQNRNDERQNRIQEEIKGFLRENDLILLEGFLRFRLKDYFMELKESLEDAIDKLLVDKEYQEFIRLLQYFVEIQEPRVSEVNVIFYDKDNFRLLDEEEKPLDQEYLRRVLGNLRDEELKYEDLLLSALITLSPQRIILHHADGPEIGKTIVNVFKERVTFCRDCELCRDLEKKSDGQKENYRNS